LLEEHFDSLGNRFGKGKLPYFSSLSLNSDIGRRAVKLEVLDFEIHQLTNTRARGVKKIKKSAVAEAMEGARMIREYFSAWTELNGNL